MARYLNAATGYLDDQRQRQATGLQAALAEQGYDVMAWDRRLALPFEETAQFLEWLGEPTPGSEHKWAIEHEEYERRRDGMQ